MYISIIIAVELIILDCNLALETNYETNSLNPYILTKFYIFKFWWADFQNTKKILYMSFLFELLMIVFSKFMSYLLIYNTKFAITLPKWGCRFIINRNVPIRCVFIRLYCSVVSKKFTNWIINFKLLNATDYDLLINAGFIDLKKNI